MSIFLDTRGKPSLGIGICARCSRKVPLSDLYEDGNSPGLRVCLEDRDPLDRWRLPPPPPDRIALDHARPDTTLYPFAPIPVYANKIAGISQIQPTLTWTHITPYQAGASITPLNVNDPAVNLPQYQFLAVTAGTSGLQPPKWPTQAGVQVIDGGVTWLCVGIALLDGITQQQPLYPNQ